jgi:hypothetical protein
MRRFAGDSIPDSQTLMSVRKVHPRVNSSITADRALSDGSH